MTDKKTIRTQIKCKTLAMSQAERLREAENVVERLKQYVSTLRPKVLAMFYPLSDEIDILPIAEFVHTSGGRVVMPRMECGGESRMEFYDFYAEQTSSGSFGVMEPQAGEPIGVEQIDLMIVPGVAFTSQGERLGRGKGYYDRYMAREGFRAQTIGVCFAHQLLLTLPIETHDRRVDMVVSGVSRELNENL